MSITYKLNKERNGVEIKFTEKPSEKVRARLKELGFRWSQYQGVWYAKQSEETVAFAKELAKEEGEQVSLAIESVSVDEIKAERKAKAEQKIKAIKEAKKSSKKSEPKKSTKSVSKKVEAEEIDDEEVEETEESKTPVGSSKKEKKDNIIVFPTKERPQINKAITSGSHTFEECAEKLEKENREVFKGSFEKYVIDGILGMCMASQNFRNNVMKEDKSLMGAMNYYETLMAKGYAYTHNNYKFINSDLEIAFSVDYFNSAEGIESIIGQAKKEVGI